MQIYFEVHSCYIEIKLCFKKYSKFLFKNDCKEDNGFNKLAAVTLFLVN